MLHSIAIAHFSCSIGAGVIGLVAVSSGSQSGRARYRKLIKESDITLQIILLWFL
jgi:hypothetical protein